MGCDTHMYIEFRNKNSIGERWQSFSGRINPGRNYFMFGILCSGVRTLPDFSFPAKGMPEDVGYMAKSDNELYISDSDEEDCTTLETAQKWVSGGISQFINSADGKPTWVTNPDWHSHSWLTFDEYAKALEFYRKSKQEEQGIDLGTPEIEYGEPEYEAVLGAMATFEHLGFDSRIVFWFDN